MRAYLAAVLIALSVIGSTLVVAIEANASGSESGEFPNRTFTVSKGLLSKSDKTGYTATIDPTIDCTWYVELVELGGASVKIVVLNESEAVLSSSKLTDVGSESERVSLIGGSAYHVAFSYVGKRGTSVLVERTGGMPVPTTPHAPILISSNDDFTSANGVVSGSGALGDPYVIEGWDIDSSTANGIEIRNADAHFIVRACNIQDGGSHDGIDLNFCSNGTLDSNNCSNNRIGIRLTSSGNNTLINNNCSFNNVRGVCLESSNNNALINNYCSSDFDSGICLQSSSYNILNNNTCISSYYYGIDLEAFSNSNTIVNNICRLNYHDGIWIATSSSNTLRNNNCSSNNRCGITLFSGNNNEVTLNLILNNAAYGVNVSLSFCSYSRIWNNAIFGNNGAGSIYDPSHVQAFDDGSNTSWSSTDVFGNYWGDWTTPDVAPPEGIVDFPYDIAGSAGAKDYYPLTTTPTEPIQ